MWPLLDSSLGYHSRDCLGSFEKMGGGSEYRNPLRATAKRNPRGKMRRAFIGEGGHEIIRIHTIDRMLGNHDESTTQTSPLGCKKALMTARKEPPRSVASTGCWPILGDTIGKRGRGYIPSISCTLELLTRVVRALEYPRIPTESFHWPSLVCSVSTAGARLLSKLLGEASVLTSLSVADNQVRSIRTYPRPPTPLKSIPR